MAIVAPTQCLLETGAWLSPLDAAGKLDSLHTCCAACIHLPGCNLFELRRDNRCVLEANVSLPESARGVVLQISQRVSAPRRQLRQYRRRHKSNSASASQGSRSPLRLPSTCTPWKPFTPADTATHCAELAHPERYVLSECDRPGGAVPEISAAQANELYPIGECSAVCLYHPLTPTTAGWMLDTSGQCFRPWRVKARDPSAATLSAGTNSGNAEGNDATGGGSASSSVEASSSPPTNIEEGSTLGGTCLRALLERPADLARILGKVSRACPLRAACRVPAPISTAALRNMECAPRHAHRNTTTLCAAGPSSATAPAAAKIDAPLSGGGSGAVSLDIARAQINRLWDRCASRCLYEMGSPLAGGWMYDAVGECYRPFRLSPPANEPLLHVRPRRRRRASAATGGADMYVTTRVPMSGQHDCLSRRAVGASRVSEHASTLCTECGEPQRREACHDLVKRQLDWHAHQPAGVGWAASSVWEWDSVQEQLATAGLCRMPCRARLFPTADAPPLPPATMTAIHPLGDSGAVAGAAPSTIEVLQMSAEGGEVIPLTGVASAATTAATTATIAASSAAPPAPVGPPQPWTSIAPVWLGAMRLDWDAAGEAARAAVLKEWVAFVRWRLDLGAARASSCAARTLQVRTAATVGFIELSGAREQMHKNKFVVSDALYFAHVLGRALIEPHVSDSRLGNERPTKTSAVTASAGASKAGGASGVAGGSAVEAGAAGGNRTSGEQDEEAAEEAAEAAAAAIAASREVEAARAAVASAAMAAADVDGARRFAGLGLRHYWDLEPLCAKFDLVPRAVYHGMRRGGHVVISPRAPNRGIGLWRLHSRQAVLKAFQPVGRARTIEIRGMWRSVTNSEALRDANLPYQGVALRPSAWELNPGYELIALQLIGGLMDERANGRFLAVQWRSEDWQKQLPKSIDPASPDALRGCANWAAARIRDEMRKHNLTEAFLATDLRVGASGTYISGRAQSEALSVLHRAVPRMRHTKLRAFIDAIPDAGVRANVETAICLKSTAMLATTIRCRNCAHARRCAKLSSAFGHYIVERRKAFRRPIEPLF